MKRTSRLGVFLAVLAVTASAITAGLESAAPRSAQATSPHVANLDDYWSGAATWSLVHQYSQVAYGTTVNDGGFGAGPTITIGPDGVWNWFYRTSEPWAYRPGDFDRNTCTSADTEFTLAGTVMRRSTDKGATWVPPLGSLASPVVLPTAGTPWACQATDGSAIWDGSQWNYVFQCLGSQTNINFHGCRVTNSSVDPTAGTWVSDPANPILGDDVPGAKLWDQICDSPTDDCVSIPNKQLVQQSGANKVGQAGTFSLFRAPTDPGWIYMDFHGVDNQVGYQYMGVAKTQDFHTWVANGPGLPADDIYDRLDSVGWREPATPLWNQSLLNNAGENIGGGGNALFPDPVTGRYYNLADASNAATCANNTVFDQGMLRSNTLTNTTWEQPTLPAIQNPFLYSEKTELSDEILPNRCGPSYTSMFNDPTTGETYLLFYGRSSQQVLGDYLFKLKRNILANGDAFRCVDVAPWSLPPLGGTFNIWRDGVYAADGMCYFTLANYISQDVSLPASRDYSSVSWGGSFSARQSLLAPPMGYQSTASTGTAVLTLTQLNAVGLVLSTTTQTVPLTGTYIKPSMTTAISPLAATLRYAVTPQNLATFTTVLADEMYVRPL